MSETLALLTPTGATLPADGALVVRRSTAHGPPRGPGALTVRAADGAEVAVEIQPLADGLERWRLTSIATRDLEIVDGAGAVVARIHQRATRGPALAAPRIQRLTSTAGDDALPPALGVPGSAMALDLAAPAPRAATLLVAELVSGVDASAWFVIDATRGKRYARSTYPHKGCAPGPQPVIAGSQLRFAWLDAAGRMSRRSRTVTVAHAR